MKPVRAATAVAGIALVVLSTLLWQRAAPGESGTRDPTPGGVTATLAVSTLFDGSGAMSPREVLADASGDFLVVGHTTTPANEFPSARRFGPLGDSDVFVAKFDPTGARLLWITLVGGTGKDRGYGVDVDSRGEIYVAGRTSSLDFPTTAGAYARRHRGGTHDPAHGASDAYVFKLSADGSRLVYSTYLGGSKNDRARGGLAVDGEGFAYVVGSTASPDYLSDSGARVNDYIGGDTDAVVTKVSRDGSKIVYTRFLGASGPDVEEIVAGARVDAEGYLYTASLVRSGGALTTDGSRYRGGTGDVYLAKITPDGQRLAYATYWGGSGSEFVEHRMELDAQGNIYVVGATNSTDLPVTGAHQPQKGGWSPCTWSFLCRGSDQSSAARFGRLDGFLVKFDPTGRAMLATYIGGSAEDTALGPALDAHGNIFVTGATASPDFEVTPNAHHSRLRGVRDAFLRMYDRDGRLRLSTLIGGSGADRARYVAVDALGHPIVIGETESPDFPTTVGAYNRTHQGGENDGFLTKLMVTPRP